MAGGVEGAIRASAAEVIGEGIAAGLHEGDGTVDVEGPVASSGDDYLSGEYVAGRDIEIGGPVHGCGRLGCGRLGALGVAVLISIAVALGLGLAFWLIVEVWTPADRAKVLDALAPPVVTVLVFLALFGVPTFLLLRAGERRRTGEEAAAATGIDAVVTKALVLNYEAVFRRGRARIDTTFKIQMGILVLLALVLVAGLAGAIAASLARQLGVAAGSGSASVVGLISSRVLKPYAEIRKALADAQRLDFINAELSDQLDRCRKIEDLVEQGKCADKVWRIAQRQLKKGTA